MSILSVLGKIILSLVIVGVAIGGGLTYLYFNYVSPQIEKLSTIDQINYELEKSGQEKISMNILNGAISRE